MLVRAAVLIAFDENRVAARDEQAGGRVAREVVVERQLGALVGPRDARLGDADEARGRRRFPDEPALEDSSRWLSEPTSDPVLKNVARSPIGYPAAAPYSSASGPPAANLG